jgi:hypothetical protein
MGAPWRFGKAAWRAEQVAAGLCNGGEIARKPVGATERPPRSGVEWPPAPQLREV